jgi:hypothetical protein
VILSSDAHNPPHPVEEHAGQGIALAADWIGQAIDQLGNLLSLHQSRCRSGAERRERIGQPARLVREKQQVRGVPSEIARAVNQRHGVAWLNHAIATRGEVGIPDWMPR